MAPGAAGDRRVVAVRVAASSADAAVLGLTLLEEETYPRHRHHRRPHHSFLESLQVPCVHVVAHTASHQLCGLQCGRTCPLHIGNGRSSHLYRPRRTHIISYYGRR